MLMSKKINLILSFFLLFLLSCSNQENSSEKNIESEEKKIRWKMASTFAGNLTQLGSSGVRFSEQIKKISGGNINVKFFKH